MLDLKTSGYLQILAGLLLLTRLIPIFANLPEGFSQFPPATTEDMAILAAHNTAGYHYSHLMALFALPLLWLGFFSHYQRYLAKGMVRRAVFGMVGLTVAVTLFSIAVLIDGYLVPLAAAEYVAPTMISSETALYFVMYSHALAMLFFTPSALFFAIGLGLLASPMAHGQIHSKWFGFAGIFLANLGVFGHIFDWTLNGMPLGASVMMAFFIWTFLLGFSSLAAHKREKTAYPLC
jgi:hypothetical protein